MQGQLRNEYVSVKVKTSCDHCSQPFEIEIDSNLDWKVMEKDCEPIVFVPDVDIFAIEADSIIDSF